MSMREQSTPKISVIIPTYNRAKKVLAAVDSVLNQTLLPYEILVVDDGSTDNTKELLSDYEKSVRYICKENGGVSSARNFGISAASGEWIAFLDSDDTWKVNKLEMQVECLTGTGADVCFTGAETNFGVRYDEIHKMDSTLKSGEYRSYNRPIEFITKTEKHPMIQSLVIRTELISDLGGFDEELYVSEDTALFYKLASEQKIALINESLVVIDRVRSSAGLSDHTELKKAEKRYDSYVKVQLQAYSLLSKYRKLDIYGGQMEKVEFRLQYFMSRRAEILHLIGKHSEAVNVAKEGLVLSRSPIGFLKCFLLSYFHYPITWRARNKWSKVC